MSEKWKSAACGKCQKFAKLCGRVFLDADPGLFPSEPYRDRILIFCTESCKGAFRTNPDRFTIVHRNLGKISMNDQAL